MVQQTKTEGAGAGIPGGPGPATAVASGLEPSRRVRVSIRDVDRNEQRGFTVVGASLEEVFDEVVDLQHRAKQRVLIRNGMTVLPPAAERGPDVAGGNVSEALAG